MGYFFIIFVIIVMDQVSKKIIENKFEIGERIAVIQNRLYIEHIKNKGAAMGLLEKKPHALTFMILFSLSNIIIIFLRLLNRPQTKTYKISLACILGGAFGNIIDRLLKKEVTDFIAIKNKKAPIFNVADIFVFIGCVIFFIKTLIDDRD